MEEDVPLLKASELTKISAKALYGEVGEFSVSALRSHGGDVSVYPDGCDVVFPTGTVQEEVLPRLRNCRYKITLPDGFQIEGMVDRESGRYTLRFPLNILPEHLQGQYKENK